MNRIVKFLLILLSLQMVTTTVMASGLMSNRYDMRFVHQGKRYTIQKNQVFNATCRNGTCIFRANGLRLSVSEAFLKPASGSVYGGSSSTASYSSSSELGHGGQSYYTPRSSYGFSQSSGGSRLAQCYQQRSQYYSSRGGCTSGNRRCNYSKLSNQSTGYCFRYVKLILQDCGATAGYLPGRYAKDAGPSLMRSGFKRWPSLDPRTAPVGSVLVYSNQCRSTHVGGHIEIKIGPSSYASDFVSSSPISARTSCRKVTGIYYK